MWYVVTALDAIHAGPKPWDRETLSTDLAALNVHVRVQRLAPATPLHIVDPTTGEAAWLLPQSPVMPTLAEWEVLTGPTETVVPGLEVTATYGKQDRSKASVYDEKLRAVLASRGAKLTGGFTADSGNIFSTALYDLISFVSAHMALETGVRLEADLAEFGAWRTDGSFKAISTVAELNAGLGKLYDWIRDINATARGHITNLKNLRDDLDGPWALGYLGPGHGVPFMAEDLFGYDITVGWP